ncbi:hypothetical protein [Aureimonas leprariae]|uniref:TniQ protein n=1 Tax=Plantimonas leprariae TaxID=2615207 RepID=A0A7V7PNX5_9HYPH|nr:hypothetical protein [Aureimonas leprariae]KAB0679549.1 hypothetical protein F6X38_12045 [Aureimonas leprariae]
MDDEATLRRERMGRRWSTRSGYVVCGECLDEDVSDDTLPFGCRTWRRGWWGVAGLRTCPIHDRPLRRVDMSSPWDSRVRHVRDDASSSRPRSDWSSSGHRRPSSFEIYMRARIEFGERSSTFLDDLPMGVVRRLCEQVGLLSSSDTLGRYLYQSDDELHAAEAAGYEVAGSGLDDLCAVIESALVRPGGSCSADEAWNMTTRISRLFVEDGYSAHDIGPIRNVLGELLCRFGGTRGAFPTTSSPSPEVRIDLSSFSARCGTTPAKVRDMLVRTGLIDEGLARLRANRLFVPARWVEKVVTMLEGARWVSAAAASIHMPTPVLVDLVEAGLVEHMGATGIPEAGLRIANDAVADFMKRLERAASSRACDAVSVGTGDADTIPTVAERTGVVAAEIVKGVMDGRIACDLPKHAAADFRSFLVREEEVRCRSGVTCRADDEAACEP